MLKTLNGSACCCFYRPPLHTPLKMFLFLIFFRVHSPLALHTFFFFFSHRVEPTPNTWKMEGRRGEREAVEKIKTFKWKQHRKIICASPRTACASSQCLLVSIIFLLHQHQPPTPARNLLSFFFFESWSFPLFHNCRAAIGRNVIRLQDVLLSSRLPPARLLLSSRKPSRAGLTVRAKAYKVSWEFAQHYVRLVTYTSMA